MSETTPTTKTTTWIVGYDFSELSLNALQTAARMLSQQGGGRLVVAHVHQLGTGVDGSGIDLATLAPGQLEHAYIADARRQLAEELAQVVLERVTIEPRVIAGRPAPVLCALAHAEHADLIVVGSHGRRGIDRLFIGSVAESILRQAICPVLVVKAPISR